MKLTADELKALLNEEGKIDESKLNELNKSIESEVSKSFSSGIEKAKKDTEQKFKAELEEKSKNTNPEKNSEVEELRKKLSEFEGALKATTNEQKISEFKKKSNKLLSSEQIENLIETVSPDNLDALNLEFFARKSVEDEQNDEQKVDPNIEKQKVSDEDLLKELRANR